LENVQLLIIYCDNEALIKTPGAAVKSCIHGHCDFLAFNLLKSSGLLKPIRRCGPFSSARAMLNWTNPSLVFLR
jgi:hypothetical protein